MEVSKLSLLNIEEIRELYNAFLLKAREDYFFELPPLNFDDFKNNFADGYIKGYYSKEGKANSFLLYTDVLNQAVEITLIYTEENENSYKIKTTLLEKFLSDIKSQFHNKIISYPMLGVQNYFTQDITNLGFKLAGEMITELDFKSSIANTLLNKINIPELPANISTDTWNDVYLTDVAEIIHNRFSKLNDAKFDPRFLNTNSTEDIIEEITKGYYGEFNPKHTTILKNEQEIIGVCFLNFTTPQIANIPLIAIKDGYENKGYGKYILYNSVTTLKKSIENGENEINVINATCDTENFPACKTYRAIGFKEKTFYSHAYMEI